MRADNKTDRLSVRIHPALKATAEKAAWQDRRTLSSLIEILLEKHCRELGLLEKEKGRRMKATA